MNRSIIVMLVVIVSILTNKAWAWGVLGHQTVALIAEAYLSEAAKEKVSSLLSGRRLVDIAMEADNMRDSLQYRHTKNYHFQNIDFYSGDDRQSYRKQLFKDRDFVYKFGAVEAIVKAQSDLASSTVDEATQRMAIKLLTHFVADLHQPLHTGLKRQKGGNMDYVMWNHKSQNLHAIWDSAVIDESAHEKNRTGRALAWNFAKSLIKENHKAGKSMDLGTPELWFIESLGYQRTAMKDIKRLSERNYQKWAAAVTDTRIYWAGRRLAEVINMSVSQKPVSEFTKFKTWLTSQFGDLSRVVRF